MSVVLPALSVRQPWLWAIMAGHKPIEKRTMTQPAFPGMESGTATLSECGRYRYDLVRRWSSGRRIMAWILLNPSTADAREDDPTVRRCIRFAKDMHFAGMAVLNLFAFRATDPSQLLSAEDPVGPENDKYLRHWMNETEFIVCGWGANVSRIKAHERVQEVLEMLDRACLRPRALGLTNDGHPKHPLYLPKETRPGFWDPAKPEEVSREILNLIASGHSLAEARRIRKRSS